MSELSIWVFGPYAIPKGQEYTVVIANTLQEALTKIAGCVGGLPLDSITVKRFDLDQVVCTPVLYKWEEEVWR